MPILVNSSDERLTQRPRLPGELHFNLEQVRRLQIRFNRAQPDKVNLSVEYVGGRIKVFEVDRHLFERLLEQLEDQGE